MTSTKISPVVMAGGVGSRLWPLSRTSFPKQFQSLVNFDKQETTLLQQTLLRLQGLNLHDLQIICHESHRFLTAEQMRSSKLSFVSQKKLDIVLEPCSRSTAPAVIIAALRLQAKQNNAPMVVLSADHAIKDHQSFQKNLLQAAKTALQGYIVTLGVPPTFASTGYGYICKGKSIGHGFSIDRFIEKPDIVKAEHYMHDVLHLWNSGMFIVTPETLLQEAGKHCPQLLSQCQRMMDGLTQDLDFVRIPQEAYAKCENISIDYAVMEHTNQAVVIPASFSWCDVGDYRALATVNETDEKGNVCVGDVETVDSSNCYIHASSKLVATLGVDNLAVVETKDAVLVAHLGQAQQVKDVVNNLSSRPELTSHRETFRPWGSYDSIEHGENYQVKRIKVNPGQRLSLQKHKYRAEHWVVVKGVALVHLDGVEHELRANDSIYIPKGAIHSLANQGDDDLYLIEVQSGSYLGEDDIERLDDIYGRRSDE